MTLNVLDGKYEYTKKDLIGHGAFAIVFKGKQIKVSLFLFPKISVIFKSKKQTRKKQAHLL